MREWGCVRDESEYRWLVHLPPQSSEVAEECSIAELSDHHPWGERDKEMEAFLEALQRINSLPCAHLWDWPAPCIYQLLWCKDHQFNNC